MEVLERPPADEPVIEPSSSTWRALKERLEQERRVAVRSLCQCGVNVHETENLRGRIAIIDKVLSWGVPLFTEVK